MTLQICVILTVLYIGIARKFSYIPGMRFFLCCLAIFLPVHAFYAVAASPEHPKQWQYQPSLEVPPGPIPRDRCIRAVYNTTLQDETGLRAEWWNPPVDPDAIRWLEWQRDQGNLTLSFCDVGGST